MSKIEKCTEGNYKDFENIKRKIIEEANKILKKYDKNGQRNYYLGISIYKILKRGSNNKYEIIYSISFFKNDKNQLIIRENEFSGLIFDKITLTEEEFQKGEKSFNYLKYFFNDINLDCSNYIFSSENLNYIIFSKNLNDDYIFQFIFIYCQNEYEVVAVLEDNIKSFLKEIDNAIDCIPYSNIKLKIKDSKVLEDNYIMIFDLKRNEKRKKDYLVNADAVLTRKLIFDILAIANKYNFKSLNHTGDGFILMYMENKHNISNDLMNFFVELAETINNLDEYLSSLTSEINNYQIRGIVDLCPKLFEFNYFGSYNTKIFYSKYLDEIFDKFKSILINENEKLKENSPKILFAIKEDKNINVNLETIKDLSDKFKFWKFP